MSVLQSGTPLEVTPAPTPSSQSWLASSSSFQAQFTHSELSKLLFLIKPKPQTQTTVIPYKEIPLRDCSSFSSDPSHLENEILFHKPHFPFLACSSSNLDLVSLSITHQVHVCKQCGSFIIKTRE